LFKFISSKIFYIFLCLSPLSSFAQLEANFSVSDSVICAGDTVDFTDLTTGGLPNFWVWSFVGAEPNAGIVQNPVDIVYPDAGIYDILLGVFSFFPADTDTIFVPGLITVNVCASPIVASFSIVQNPICAGDSIDFTDGSTGAGINSWSWSFEGGTPDTSNLQSPANLVFETAGTYDIVLEISDGVLTDDTVVTITVIECAESLVADFSFPAGPFCPGDTLNFQDQSTAGSDIIEWNWNFVGASPLNSSIENPIFIIYPTAGTFTVTLIVTTDFAADTATASITIGTCEVDVDISAEETVICLGECTNFFNESTGSTIDSYLWNFESADIDNSLLENPTGICYSTPGVYDVTLTVTIDGDETSVLFPGFITVVDTCGTPFADFEFEPLICQGSCVNYTNNSTSNVDYLWTFQGATPPTSTLENPVNICYNTTGNFTVTLLVTNGGFSSTITQNISVVVGPTVNAGADISINQGASATLSAVIVGGTGDGEFEWQPFEEVSNFSSQTVTISPDENTLFIVTYQEEGGCLVTDEVNVIVSYVASVGVPSAFSPNKDGINDVLRVLGEGITKLEFKVFNRYGQLVFESENVDKGWDGLHNEREVNPGVFTYYAKVTYKDGDTEFLKGNVTLVR
jgi:gliding motility-associated-like protein